MPGTFLGNWEIPSRSAQLGIRHAKETALGMCAPVPFTTALQLCKLTGVAYPVSVLERDTGQGNFTTQRVMVGVLAHDRFREYFYTRKCQLAEHTTGRPHGEFTLVTAGMVWHNSAWYFALGVCTMSLGDTQADLLLLIGSYWEPEGSRRLWRADMNAPEIKHVKAPIVYNGIRELLATKNPDFSGDRIALQTVSLVGTRDVWAGTRIVFPACLDGQTEACPARGQCLPMYTVPTFGLIDASAVHSKVAKALQKSKAITKALESVGFITV